MYDVSMIPPPVGVASPKPRKRFFQRRWVQITLSIVATIFVFSCGLFVGGVRQHTQDLQDAQVEPMLTPQYQVTTLTDQAYGPLAAQGERLDLCVPQGVATPRPGIILIHGGGWIAGDKKDFATLCTYFAGLGLVVANIDYRLGPTFPWPAQIVDAQLAVRFLRAHAALIHLDSKRLCSFGASAGAHLAMFLGILAAIHPGDEASLMSQEPVQTTCVVSWSGPVDLLTLPQANATIKAAINGLFGAVPDPASVRDASPIFQVTASTAPMLLIQGTTDEIVPHTQAGRMQQALRNAGVFVQLAETNGGHDLGDAAVVLRIIELTTAFILAHSI